MPDKKLKVSNLAFTELSIKIATLDMKVSKILELLNKPQDEYVINQDIRVTGAAPGHGASFVGVMDYLHCDKITPHCIEGKSCECSDKFTESLKVAQLTDEEWSEDYK